jgi:hypothetical protein
MVRKEDRVKLQILSVILLFGAFFAYSFIKTGTIYGMTLSTAPYRQYALPLAVLGIIGIMMSFLIPINNNMNNVINVSFCRNCGKQIHWGVKFCPNCGKEQFQ